MDPLPPHSELLKPPPVLDYEGPPPSDTRASGGGVIVGLSVLAMALGFCLIVLTLLRAADDMHRRQNWELSTAVFFDTGVVLAIAGMVGINAALKTRERDR